LKIIFFLCPKLKIITYLCRVEHDKDTTKKFTICTQIYTQMFTQEYKDILKKGDYVRIARMVSDVYQPDTVLAQLTGRRTLTPIVKAAADEYIETMNKLLTPKQLKNENT